MYRLINDGPDWPADLARTISAHHELHGALAALDEQLARRDAQLTANGEGGSSLSLIVIDDTGQSVATADVTGRPPVAGWPRWTPPDAPSDWSFFD